MSEQSQLNFNIPKIKRQLSKDNLRNVALTSRDAVELLQSVDRCYLDTEVKGQWEVKSIQTFDNRDLEKAYREKRTELKDNGRHARELTEQYGFMYIKETNVIVPSIAKQGLRTKAGQFNGLGDSKSGVYVNKHPDVQLKIAEQNDDKTAYLCVFKLTLGRCKAQQISNCSENPIEPTPNYDSHVCASVAQVNTLHSVQHQKSQVYLYEYTDEALPSDRPRHCLPYALLQYEKTKGPSSTYGRSAYGSKTTNIDYSWKAGQSAGPAQWKSRGDGSTSRRNSYESAPSYNRHDSQAGIPKPGREDPRIARKRNSIDATSDPRQIPDLRLISTDPRLSGVDPKTSTNDPRVKVIDPRLATTDPRMQGDPRLVQGDPHAVSRSLVIPPNQFTPNDPRLSQPEQKTVSPEMKSMIKTVSQLWGTTPQSEVAFVSEDQADNSIVKQVQEQMEQKRAEKKKISLADYSKTRKKPTVPVPTIPVTAVDVLTSVSSASDNVSNSKMNQAVISASSSVTNEIYPPSKFSIAKSPIALVHYSPSVGASVSPVHAPESTVLPSDYTQGSVEAATAQSINTPLSTPLPLPVPAPVPAPERTHFSEFSSLSTYPVSLPSIMPSPLPETPSPISTYDSDPDFNDVMSTPISGSSGRGMREFDEDEFDASPSDAVSSSPVSSSLKSYSSETKDGECLSLGVGEHVSKIKTLTYSPKGTAGYKDPYAAVKRQSAQSDISTPVSLLPDGHPAVNLFGRESPKSPQGKDVMYDPFEQSMMTAPVEADVFQSPVVSDLMERPVVDDIQSPQMSNSSSCEPSPGICEINPLYQREYQPSHKESKVEPIAGDMSDPQSNYQPSPIKSASVSNSHLGYQPSPTKMGVHDNPFSFLNKDPIPPVVQYSPLTISSQASESPSSQSVSSLAPQQSQGASLQSYPAAQAPTSNQAYVSNLVSKFQAINPGDFKDIITKMKSLQSQSISEHSGNYRDLGSTGGPAVATGIQHYSQSDRQEFRSDTREDRRDSSARDSDTRQWDSWHSSRRDTDSYRDSRYSSARDGSYSRSSSRYRDEKDERRRGSRHDDYWGRHDEDVDYRRHDSRRHKYDSDDRDHRGRDSRSDKRSYIRRNSPRQDDASRYGDVDLRSSQYESPRRPDRSLNVEKEKKTTDEKSRKFSLGGGEHEDVEEHARSDLDRSDKNGTAHGISEKCDDLSEGVWMAPRLDASDSITSDIEMTPVKSSQPEDNHQPFPITLDVQKNLDDKSERRLLFDGIDSPSKSSPELGGLNERGNVFSTVFDLHGNTTPPRPPSRGRPSESPRANQARSWTELIEEEDNKIDVKEENHSDVDQEHPGEEGESSQEKSLMKSNQESATETMKFADKRGKKRKVAKDMAGYTKRKKRGKRGRGKKIRLNKLIDEDEHQPSWSPRPDSFSIEFEHDEPDYCDFSFDQPHQYVETIPNSEDDDYSYVTETTSMTSRTASPTSEYLSHLGLSHLGKSDLLPVLELVDIFKMSVSSCKQCFQCRDTIIPYLHNVALDTSEEEGDDCPDEDEKLDIKGTEYYMKNCLPGLDLISPPEEKKPVVKREVKTEKAITSEDKIHETVDIKPVVKEERVEEKTVGYNSCEGDKPLYLKLQSTPTKAGRIDDEDSKETKSVPKSKLTEDGELDVNGTHSVFSPMKGLVKRKLSITLCVGGKKRKSQAIAEADATLCASTPPVSASSKSSSSSSSSSVPVTVTPSVGPGAARTPPLPTGPSRGTPTIQYKVGFKKSVKAFTPSSSEGLLQTDESAIPSSVQVKHGGQSIPVLGMSWSGPQTSTQFPSNDNVTHSQNSALNEWISVSQNSTMMLPTQPIGNESAAYSQVVRSELCRSNMNIASTQPVVIPRYTQPSQVPTMVSQPTQVATMAPQPTQVPTMAPQLTQIPTMVPQQTQVPTMVPPPTRLQLPNYGCHQPHQIMPCGIPSISQQAATVSQHTGSLQSLPIRLHQPPIPSVSQQMPLRHPQMTVSQQVHGRLQLQPSHPQGLTTNTVPMGQQLPHVRHPVMIPQIPDRGIQHMPTAYRHPSMGSSALIQPQYRYPLADPHSIPTRPPPWGFGIPLLRQQSQMSVQHAVPVSLEQSYNPAMFNPNQPQPVRLNRPASTLVQVNTSGPPMPPETKRSSDPADWFADMFAPKKRETSWSKESTPESGLFSGFDKGEAGSGPSETSSVTSSPITQVPFLGESSRDVFSGETMHSGKDIKAKNTQIKQVVLKSLVKRVGNDRSRSVSPEPNCIETNSTSPYSDLPSFSERNTPSPSSGSQVKERLSKQPLDFLSKERAKILHALRNLPTSASDSEESQVESKTEEKLEITVSSDNQEQDVRRVEFQRKMETNTNADLPRTRIKRTQDHYDYQGDNDDDPYTRGSIDDRRKHGKENQDSIKKVGYFDRSRPVSMNIASKWTEYLQDRDKRGVHGRRREPVDYHDELELYKCDQDLPETMDNTPDDSSSVSGDSIEDLEELSIKLNYERSKAIGRVQEVPLTIEMYLRHKLFVSDPNKVRDKFPWPLNTVLTEQTKNKRRRMVQKAKIVASHYAKKQSKGKEVENPVKSSTSSKLQENSNTEIRLEDFTKEQILLELQVVQECIKKCSNAGTCRKNTGQSVDIQNPKQQMMPSQTCPNPNVDKKIQDVRENVLDMERAKNLGMTVVQFQQMKAQNMKRQIMMNNTFPQLGNSGLKNKMGTVMSSQMTNNPGMMKQLQMIDPPMNNPRIDNNPQKFVFEKLKEIQMMKLQKIQMTRSSSPSKIMMGNVKQWENTENEDMEVSFDHVETDEVLEQSNGPLNREKGALQQIAQDLIEGFQKLTCVGRPHQKVPDDILLQSEKNKYHSEEGVFLMLLSAISKKPYLRLLSMKVDLEMLVKQKLEAATQNKTHKVMEMRRNIKKLHDERKKLLTTFVGSLGKKRLRKLNVVKTKYQLGVAYLRKELGDDGWRRLQYIYTMHQTINTHVHIVQTELASPTL